jgi:prepilin-type N-terminal cleavage/methylation domain-containing protein
MLSNTRKGFTLIELLIVVVIIGILAAIAIPKFATTKEKAYMATMKSDLRNLVTAQEGYFSDNQAFTTDLSPAGLNFDPSTNVTIVVNSAVAADWDATATHAIATTKTCVVAVGAAVVAPMKEGVPDCS